MSDNSEKFLTVGIGASAGGLAVLKTLVRNLTPPIDMAFVIIQHLDPNHKSLLVEILDKEAHMPVVEAKDQQQLTPDHIYVIPPDTYLELEGEKIRLKSPRVNRGSRKAIDHFFRSLADNCGNKSVGIVLSGSGSDGTAGLRAIRAAGGLTLAQEPETAEHDSMPLSAIQANIIDKIVTVEAIPAIIKQFADHPLTLIHTDSSSDIDEGENLEEVTAILRTHQEFDLRQYKPPTVLRRIARRMSLLNIREYADYLKLLRKDEEERRRLTKDLLINVTDFFRDPEAFEVLERKIIPNILKGLKQEEDIRVWVSGCASGEEAYSIAILLLEARAKAEISNTIKIFATDIDEYAIKIARKGIYPESIAGEVPGNYLEKYFTKIENHQNSYRINNKVRDLISFAIQNVVTDPPFHHLQLICCRNLLIYFKKEIQEKVLSAFYFALEEDSYLFLGSSETIGSKLDTFKTISKKWRIYQKIPGRDTRQLYLDQMPLEKTTNRRPSDTGQNRKTRKSPSRSDTLRRSLLETYLPPGVIINKDGIIIYNHGNWKRYLSIPTGEPRNEITQLVIPALRSRMRSALYKVRKNWEALSFRCPIPAEDNTEARKMVQVELAPINNPSLPEEEVIGIIFREIDLPPEQQDQLLTKDDETKATHSLELELAETKEELQNTIEELETSTEELKASHEEALSTNEELQSANEELEASAEEMRSMNEELSTVNAQLKDKIEELQKSNNDVENFFASTNLPTIFLDPELLIQRYTPAAEQLLKMGPRDIGRHISSLGRDLVDSQLTEECRKVLQNFQPIRREVQSSKDGWFIRQITPYRTEDRRIEGVVLVFQDVTEIKQLSKRAEDRERQQAVVAKLGLIALSGAEPGELIHQAVRQVAHTMDVDFCKVLKYQPEQENLLLISGIGWQNGLVGRTTVPAGQNSQAGFTLLSQEPVIVRNLNSEKRFQGPELLTDHQVVSGISCLINHSDPPYGIMSVHTRSFREFTPDDTNFLISVAHLLSTALRAKEDQEQLRESEERLTMAREAAQIGIHDHDLITDTVKWDRLIFDIWGIPEENAPISYKRFLAGLHPDDREPTRRLIKAALKGRRREEIRVQFRVINQHDQQVHWVEATAKIIYRNGDPVRMVGTVQDISERVEDQVKLAASERKLRMALETNRFGSFEYYIQHEQTEWDDILKAIWGITSGETPTQKIFWEGIHPEDVEMVKANLENATNNDGDGYYHVVYRVINRQSGKLFWVEASGQTIFENDAPLKMVGMIIDITERKALESSLQKAVRELQEADLKKNNFLAILGHELRNPLTALKAGLDVLENRTEAPENIFPIMERSMGTMSKLLDDLLDLNRVSQNEIHLEMQTVDLKQVIEFATSSSDNLFKGKDQRVVVDVPDNLVVKGDPTRLEQVFNNLLTNAAKYTPEKGKIKIIGSIQQEIIVIEIQDDGVGIAPEKLDKIFDPFYQIKQDNKTISGLGIGLALARKLVESHGGSIEAESDGLDRGSTFIVSLPVYYDRSTAQGPLKVDQYEVKPGLKVVLIEDDEDISYMMPLLMTPLKCDVKVARTGQEGITLTRSFQPDALLVDLGLPDIDGYTVATVLRENGYTGQLIAVSGYSHQEAREKSQAAGFDYHLAKPADLSDIAAILAKIK